MGKSSGQNRADVLPKRPQNGVVAKPRKVVANPEVATSGKSTIVSSGKSSGQNRADVLPLTPDDDFDVQFEEEITVKEKGWRLEKNSNGYYRYRWQLKDESGEPVTYVNSSGKVGYKRGSKYVPIEEAKNS